MLAKLARSGTPPSTGISSPASAITASAGTACRASRSLISSMRTRSRDSCSSPARAGDAGGKPFRIGRARAVGRVEAEEAQDAQIVLARCALPASPMKRTRRAFEIGKPADIIVHRAVARGRQRVHGEVAPLGVAPASRGRTRTLAWRPKVSTSSRSVVTSNGRPSMTTVTVPCSMPVGTALEAGGLRRGASPPRAAPWWRRRSRRPARRAARCAPRRRPRAPPRRRGRARASSCASGASRSQAASRAMRGGVGHLDLPRHELAVSRYAPARRSSPAARRRNARGR